MVAHFPLRSNDIESTKNVSSGVFTALVVSMQNPPIEWTNIIPNRAKALKASIVVILVFDVLSI